MIVEFVPLISSHPMNTACAGATGFVCVRFPFVQSHNAPHSVRAEVSKPLNLYLPFVMIGATPLREILLARSPKVFELVDSEELSAIPKVAFEPCEPVMVTTLATVWELQVVFLAFTWRYSSL
jgi:hypothetical protein